MRVIISERHHVLLVEHKTLQWLLNYHVATKFNTYRLHMHYLRMLMIALMRRTCLNEEASAHSRLLILR